MPICTHSFLLMNLALFSKLGDSRYLVLFNVSPGVYMTMFFKGSLVCYFDLVIECHRCYPYSCWIYKTCLSLKF